MNISKEQVDELNAIVNIELEPSDYADRVEKSIREHARKIKMPGFRPGKVPTGLIKKLYGRSILAEEVNHLLNDSLYQFLDKNKISYLGNPLPKEDGRENDFDNPGKLQFSYELGLTPTFDLKLDPKREFEYQQVDVSSEMIDGEVEALRKRYGKVASTDQAGADDILTVEVTVDGEEEGSFLIEKKNATIFLNRVAEEVRKLFIGATKGAAVRATLQQVWPEPEVLARILELPEEIVADMNQEALIEVKQVHSLQPADLNEELYEKIYGPGVINSEEELREKVKQDILSYYQTESDRRFYSEVSSALVKEVKVPLPEEFLKRWIKAASEKPVTDHDVEHEFHHYREHLQWELIENKILDDHEIKIESTEIADHVRQSLRDRYRQYGIQDVSDEQLEAGVKRVLARKDEARAAYQSLREARLLELFKRTFKLRITPVKPETFNQTTQANG